MKSRRGSHPSTVEVTGRVTRGRGIAAGRVEAFADPAGRLGYVPHPGTLNIHCDRAVRLADTDIEVRSGTRRYWCWPVTVNGTAGHVIWQQRSPAPRNFLEVVAPVRLRDALELDDRDRVTVRFDQQEREADDARKP